MRAFSLMFALGALVCLPAFAADAPSTPDLPAAIPATAYFPVLAYDAAPDSAPLQVPVASNHPLDVAYPGVTRGIIVIHDRGRDANAVVADISALAGSANSTTMIVAPQFLLQSDIARVASHLPDHGRVFATWDAAGWARGDDSHAVPGKQGVSSFTVVDLMLMYLGDRRRFPRLKTVVIAGYGTGADFVQRYAAINEAADAVSKENIDLRYAVAGATSFLYLTPLRGAAADSAKPVTAAPVAPPTATPADAAKDTTKEAGADAATKDAAKPDTPVCPDVNAWPYGLDKLNPYARHIGANKAKTDYAEQFISYLNAPKAEGISDTGCAAMAQGVDSSARAARYKAYLLSLYGDVAARTQSFASDSDMHDDAVGLFGSSCGMAVLFGDAICAPAFGGGG
jgi:hypothetical protein